LHASFTVSDETIAEAAELCRDCETVMHVHVAEDLADVADANERGYDGPLERLLDFEALPPGSILAHCVHCGVAQVTTAASQGLWIVQNPRSNRGNRVGYPGALGASSLVAIGTDGYPADMEAEALALEEEATVHGEDLEVARRRLAGGHVLASERLGVDLLPLDTAAPEHAPDVVTMENDRARDVTVDGKRVVEDGRLMTADLEEIHADAKEQAPLLWARMETY